MFDKVDPWFLQIMTLGLGGYFLWSIRQTLRDFKDEVRGLRETFKQLFAKDDNHEHRLSRLEGRCEATHGELPGGRRGYDPEERPHA